MYNSLLLMWIILKLSHVFSSLYMGIVCGDFSCELSIKKIFVEFVYCKPLVSCVFFYFIKIDRHISSIK